MARGNEIIVSANPRGVFDEGYVTGALKPGTIVQKDPTVALKGGRHTYVVYDRAADGDRPAGALYVLLNDSLQGRPPTTAYTTGDRCFVYAPLAGEELNVLAKYGDVSDTHTKGEVGIVDDGTGKYIATASTPQTGPFQLLETVTLTADALVWVGYTGY